MASVTGGVTAAVTAALVSTAGAVWTVSLGTVATVGEAVEVAASVDTDGALTLSSAAHMM